MFPNLMIIRLCPETMSELRSLFGFNIAREKTQDFSRRDFMYINLSHTKCIFKNKGEEKNVIYVASGVLFDGF